MIEVEPQPRIDTLVRVPGGAERRRTEYLGSVWLNGKPQIDGLRLLRPASAPKGVSLPEKNVSFFLPDSLAYARERRQGRALHKEAQGRVVHFTGAAPKTPPAYFILGGAFKTIL